MKTFDNTNDFIYQPFWFTNAVKSHFYTGDAFLHYREDMKMDELLELATTIRAEGEDGIMPGLKRQIESFLGADNYKFDGWEFGLDGFSLYWHIRRSVYHEKLDLIRQWIDFEGLTGQVDIPNKD